MSETTDQQEARNRATIASLAEDYGMGEGGHFADALLALGFTREPTPGAFAAREASVSE